MYIALVDTLSGRRFYVDTEKARLFRMANKIVAWSRFHENYYDVAYLVTLTYREKMDVQNHLSDYLRYARRDLAEKYVGCAWVLELQQRGVIHYHIQFLCRRGARLEFPDKSGWWPYGMSSVVRCRTPYYLVSYLKKRHQKNYRLVPKGLRVFGVSSVIKDFYDVIKPLSWMHGGYEYLGSACNYGAYLTEVLLDRH